MSVVHSILFCVCLHLFSGMFLKLVCSIVCSSIFILISLWQLIVWVCWNLSASLQWLVLGLLPKVEVLLLTVFICLLVNIFTRLYIYIYIKVHSVRDTPKTWTFGSQSTRVITFRRQVSKCTQESSVISWKQQSFCHSLFCNFIAIYHIVDHCAVFELKNWEVNASLCIEYI